MLLSFSFSSLLSRALPYTSYPRPPRPTTHTPILPSLMMLYKSRLPTTDLVFYSIVEISMILQRIQKNNLFQNLRTYFAIFLYRV
jgi:hypothetical protein